MLFYTGQSRQSADVLTEQRRNIEDRARRCGACSSWPTQGRDALCDGRLDEFGALLHEGWQAKRGLASGITNADIDAMYSAARRAGALGGKISGAGGGGFMLLYCPPEHQPPSAPPSTATRSWSSTSRTAGRWCC